jgi:uncharacterized protein YeaO (DUF488 family)
VSSLCLIIQGDRSRGLEGPPSVFLKAFRWRATICAYPFDSRVRFTCAVSQRRALAPQNRVEVMLKTKSIVSAIDRSGDGLRILTARFRGRGMKKSRYNVWMANLAPSESLLRDFQSGEISWAVFSRRYKSEIHENPPLDRNNRTIIPNQPAPSAIQMRRSDAGCGALDRWSSSRRYSPCKVYMLRRNSACSFSNCSGGAKRTNRMMSWSRGAKR